MSCMRMNLGNASRVRSGTRVDEGAKIRVTSAPLTFRASINDAMKLNACLNSFV